MHGISLGEKSLTNNGQKWKILSSFFWKLIFFIACAKIEDKEEPQNWLSVILVEWEEERERAYNRSQTWSHNHTYENNMCNSKKNMHILK